MFSAECASQLQPSLKSTSPSNLSIDPIISLRPDTARYNAASTILSSFYLSHSILIHAYHTPPMVRYSNSAQTELARYGIVLEVLFHYSTHIPLSFPLPLSLSYAPYHTSLRISVVCERKSHALPRLTKRLDMLCLLACFPAW